MAKKSVGSIGLSMDTIVEVIRISPSGNYVMKLMRYGEWLEFKGHDGYIYRAFERGFSQFLLDEYVK